jgi:hypothetical protein
MLVQRRAARFEHHGRGVVAVPDLHREVVHDRLGVLRPQVRGDPGDVPGEGLLDGELPDRAPFGVVRVEQPGPGHAG